MDNLGERVTVRWDELKVPENCDPEVASLIQDMIYIASQARERMGVTMNMAGMSFTQATKLYNAGLEATFTHAYTGEEWKPL